MRGKLIITSPASCWRKTAAGAIVVLALTGLSFGQNANALPQSGLLKQSNDSSATSAPVNSVPSIGDLMTVIDKATNKETKGKDWSTPVKLVIIFTGLAILPSLLVMMTSFTG